MSAPDLPHWTLNSCFGAFHSALIHLGMFCYDNNLSAKWGKLVKLMKNFVSQGRVRIFREERTQSTHWTLTSCFVAFHSVWVHLGPFRYCIKLGAKRAECGAIIAKVRAT